MLQRAVSADAVIYLQRGRVTLGLLGDDGAILHQLGVVEGPGWLEQQALMAGDPYSFDGAIDRWTQGLGGVIHGAHGLHRYVICADGERDTR